MLTRESKKTPKGTAPSPMRRATKHKRGWYTAQLITKSASKRLRREAAALGDSNANE